MYFIKSLHIIRLPFALRLMENMTKILRHGTEISDAKTVLLLEKQPTLKSDKKLPFTGWGRMNRKILFERNNI